ncbi:AAA family ATPase [Streptomyces sp. NPDC049597]|uniref:AAA family ATPase n=1 Tax=Streptomyces sp. NPDC049597 TaxID=3155276 RepID=UPI00343B72B5
MPRSLTSKKLAVVAGDAVTDWVIARPHTTTQKKGARAKGQQSPTLSVRGDEIHAGARLVEDLLREVRTESFKVARQNWRSAWEDRLFTRMSHVYATLREFSASDAEPPSNTATWRMDDYMGLIRRPQTCAEHEDVARDKSKHASLAVLVDMGIDFSSSESHWPSVITNESRTPWVILKWDNQKIGQEIKHGPLWGKLANRKNKLIVVTTADNLRHNKGIEISRGLSWERTAGDCAAALMSSNSPLHELTECAYVVISFGPVGALIFDRQADNDFTLVFDPQMLETSSEFSRSGMMWGYTSALTAAIARAFMQHCSHPEDRAHVVGAVRSGLNAMRVIYDTGFVERSGPEGTTIQFPVAETAAAIKAEGDRVAHFAEASFKASSSLHDFNILREKYNQFNTGLLELSRRVAVEGPRALKEAPRRTYGDLTTVDRDEIESFESIRDIVSGYAEKEKRAPVSIAMFGAPGSGKSTVVEEVIGSLKIYTEFDPLTFNLSQFRSPNELDEAFHLIRDARLSGNLPLVFWDEFDTYFERSLGWLRYFLSPMQDGSFREGQVIHPIGKSIFVFAGGVSHSLAHFRTQPDFVQAKAPDFLSRVHGVIDLKGIDASSTDSDMGSYYMIRRAIILHSILQSETDLFKGVNAATAKDPSTIMDSGVLDAFLTVPKYRNGVRSMKAIVSTSSLAGESHFGRSNLPARTQLNLHVDAGEFYARMRS